MDLRPGQRARNYVDVNFTEILTWKYRTNSTGMTPNGAIPVAQTLLRWTARKKKSCKILV